MMCHKIGGGWIITLPDSYSAEYIEGRNQYKFKDSESDAVIRISPLSGRSGDRLLTKEMMREAFAHSLDSMSGRVSLKDDDHEIGDGLSAMCFEFSKYNDNDILMFYMSFGIYTEGALLTASISSCVREDCIKALEYLEETTKE
ncbi:MAG: hypothetical protein IKR76_11745 [Ruminococcus sp.]|nr:hypothetical protein [Ruminococcus sp.]